ncbi:MAG: SDR family NAD(P)-dependent oxidoreductase [Haliea sp.]|jgi:short-subunit dehydrogenase|nr:SDR family NAD(P)-dependent oxidoreductase [Haliea sp.]
MKEKSQFENKTVIVTGGAAGIGRAVVEALAARGALVYAADINEAGLKAITDSVPAVIPVKLNVSQQQDFQQVIDQVLADQGHLDIIVNNAGIGLAGDFNQTSLADLEKITDINYWSVIYGTKFAYAQMIKQGHGHIVNVSSSGGAMPVPNQSMYSGIKHAVLGFSHSLREEAAHYGVKVSTVLPGMVQSDMWDSAVNVKDYNLKKSMENTGLKPISAHDAARAILKGIIANDRSIIFPRINRVTLWFYRLMPNIFTRLFVTPLAKPESATP